MRITFDTRQAGSRLNQIQQRVVYGCIAYGKAAAMKMVRRARRDRRWKDRTHHAKNAINGDAEYRGGKVQIRLSHGVKYGIYLENRRFRHKGRLNIIYPTRDKMKGEILQGWANVVKRGGG